jgi:cytochrome P450
MQAVHAIKAIRPILRPFLAPRLPEIRRLRNLEKRAAAFLEPIIRTRMEAKKNRNGEQEPDDMMEWIFNRMTQDTGGTVPVEQFAKVQLTLIFAAVHTTTMTATNVLYSLAVTPEYVEPLREEMRSVIAQNDGQITTRALQQMEKLDSYMKEVFRVYPPGASTYLFLYSTPLSP